MESEESLKKKLSKEEYSILREGNTEKPFSGEYINTKEDGSYYCKACGAKLFSSDTKFDSGSGWPSFTDPVTQKSIELVEDNTSGMVRTEVRCKNCSSHLGHVFEDGPKGKGGLRYCINSGALNLKKDT